MKCFLFRGAPTLKDGGERGGGSKSIPGLITANQALLKVSSCAHENRVILTKIANIIFEILCAPSPSGKKVTKKVDTFF